MIEKRLERNMIGGTVQEREEVDSRTQGYGSLHDAEIIGGIRRTLGVCLQS